ncbi:MAG: hypothetical protein E7599_03860, partial [Ruminococcaceae bacterium]|nr:hypothetical protein [Oscillospiraceae bacterium]
MTRRTARICIVAIVSLLVGIGLLFPFLLHKEPQSTASFDARLALLKDSVLTEQMKKALGNCPVPEAGHAVFLSVCDKQQRARVYTGIGSTPEKAWDAAANAAREGIRDGLSPIWIKADIVYTAEWISHDDLKHEISTARSEYYHWGLSLDAQFDVALLGAELNGAKIYAYEEGDIDLTYLNTYLKKAGRKKVASLPERFLKFKCYGFMMEEDQSIYPLYADGLEYGRRKVDQIDKEYVQSILTDATDFLLRQVKKDGSFVYGMYPRFDNNIEGYNILRHGSTIWSLICRYRMQPDETLKQTIEKTFDYLISQVRYRDEEKTVAYLYEADSNEFKLGGNGIMVIAMTEYMDVFQNKKYEDICQKLGNGILMQLNRETGEYYHVLSGDFTNKEEFRTVYYDGEATFALCRLYSLTKDDKWLSAARAAVDHFIEAEYEQHKDHWISYSMNEITRHVDDEEYYAFALRNIQSNLQTIHDRDTTYHTYLEFLMVGFELYDRMEQKGM